MELFNGKYQQECLLGRGAFSEVWKVVDIQTGVVQALKIYSPSTAMENDGIEMMKHEFALMANASHQNLLRPLYFDICDQRPFLVLSYCKNGNIKKKVGHFTEREAWKLLKDASSGLAYLHEMEPPVIHQDIKPENILIADNGSYMLTDFGVSTKAKSNMSQLSNEDRVFQSAGTFPYMPPEKFSKDNMPILASDIWSLGVTVYEMLMGDLPFGNEGGLRQKIGADIPEIQGDYSTELRDILVKCMAKEPWDRPKAEELEKTAISYLTYAPTVAVGISVIGHEDVRKENILLQEEHEKVSEEVNEVKDEPDVKQIKPSGKNRYMIAAVLIGLAVLAVGGFLLIQSQSHSESQSLPILPATVNENANTVPSLKQKTGSEATVEVELKQPSVQNSVSENTPEQTLTPEAVKKTVETKTDILEQETKKESSEKVEFKGGASRKGTLHYGSWSGKLHNGKPVGDGTMVITSSSTIRCSNGKSINVQAGDKITNADFDEDGYLSVGTWEKKDGQISHISP